jgi:diguanylate cyclase
MRAVDRRDWWVWTTASAVMLLLISATFLLVRPVETADPEVYLRFDREQAVRGLLGMILLFIVYSFYQQSRIKALRRELSGKIERLLSAEVRADGYEKLSMLDFLTGFYNRRFVEQHLEAEIGRAQRFDQPLTLMALDLNDFKEINDTLGHSAGDRVLKYFSERLRKAIRGSDIPVRMGGDEFLVLLPECTPDQAELLLLRLQDLTLEYEGKVIPVKFAVGCAGYVPNSSPRELPHELLERADQALYANKRAQKTAL